MRPLTLLAVAALALAGCNKADQAGNTANVDETLTADSIAANDVTAIDAVTGEAANMAADVNYTEELDGNFAGNSANTGSSNRATTAKRPAPAASATPPATSNATATQPAATNSAQ